MNVNYSASIELHRRIAAVLLIGLSAFGLALWLRYGGRSNFSDFDQLWIGARALLHGQDPYLVVPQFGYRRPLYYPLPAVLVASAFARAPMPIAYALFCGVGAGAFAFALAKNTWWALLTLLSFGTINAIELGQWSLLGAGTAALPWLGWLVVVKPTTIAAVALAYVPAPIRRRALVINVCVALGLLAWSQAINPGWIREWRAAVGSASHFAAPIGSLLGVPLVLAALRWRRPEARLVVLLACVPQSMALYETAPLGLVVRTRREAILLVAASAIARLLLRPVEAYGSLGEALSANTPILVACCYLPALFIILRRPNVGEAPEWLEHVVARAPQWLRGESAVATLQASSGDPNQHRE